MSEMAYYSSGINESLGTPLNPYRRDIGLLPGGSSSGSVVSVTDGMALAAIGTDIGGSVRTPAALCGVYGFKPTRGRISTHGVVSWSAALDSVGVMANSVDCCARVIRAAAEDTTVPDLEIGRMTLGIPNGLLLADLDPDVERAFGTTIECLAAAGVTLSRIDVPVFEAVTEPYERNVISRVESFRNPRSMRVRMRC